MIHPNDVERWRAKLDQIEAAIATDTEIQETWRELDALRPERDAEARELVAELVRSRDWGAFRTGVDAWRKRPGPYTALGGFGQMWLNQVAKSDLDDPAAIDALVHAFTTPADAAEATQRFSAVEQATKDLSARPAPGRIPFVLSVFWSTDPVRPSWPIQWASAPDRMFDLGWIRNWANAERYLAVLEAARTYTAEDIHRFERLMWFLTERQRFVGLNPTLAKMCAEAAELMGRFDRGQGYPSQDEDDRAASLAAQLKGELQLAMVGLLDEVRETAGLDLEKSSLQLRTAFDQKSPYRADAYATWTLPGGMSSPGFRLWATRSGLALGVYGGWGGGSQHDYDDIAAAVAEALPEGYQFFQVHQHRSGDRLKPVSSYAGGEVFAGRWWSWADVPQGLALRDEVLTHVAELAKVIEALTHRAGAQTSEATTVPNEELLAALAQFRAERPYPNDKDPWQEEQRAAFAEAFSSENLAVFDLDLFRKLVNGKRYGNPGPQSVLNASLGAMDSIELDGFASKLRQILWGENDVADRIDRALDWDDLGTKGLGESVLLKLFAVTDPQRFLPVFPLGGPMGKIAMLRKLDLPEPDGTLSRGQQHLVANDTLKQVLEPLLPGDSWGQGQFAYWLLDHDMTVAPPDEDRLALAASELLVPEEFLRQLEELLKEKGQLIFYGPPGTGKTYLADRFAAALQPEQERRMVVQFHPSMSYEDFFEGYRPQVDERKQMYYELRPGPLALMVEKAEAAPGTPHILIIDEINRANLPRVFGELLYLLEYRNKAVRTAYRADEPFELPKNLFFIGTMNTADRSIAMVDAALRRRFHFIPFMPHEGHMATLLSEWLKKHGEPTWVANLVDRVNEQLRVLLKGPHLQVGHSHFMLAKEAGGAVVLTEQRLGRIWEYDVYPSIEDQLHGRPDQLTRFTWAEVLAAYGPDAKIAADLAADGDDEADEPAH